MKNTTRKEHVAWCKERALAYVETSDLQEAFTSMISDLDKHPETARHPAGTLGLMLLMGGHLGTPQKMREFIEGFH